MVKIREAAVRYYDSWIHRLGGECIHYATYRDRDLGMVEHAILQDRKEGGSLESKLVRLAEEKHPYIKSEKQYWSWDEAENGLICSTPDPLFKDELPRLPAEAVDRALEEGKEVDGG